MCNNLFLNFDETKDHIIRDVWFQELFTYLSFRDHMD